jgi:hypothetical protein
MAWTEALERSGLRVITVQAWKILFGPALRNATIGEGPQTYIALIEHIILLQCDIYHIHSVT